MLGALLHDLNGAIPVVVVAEAASWTLTRVQEAADALTLLLEPAGLTVQQNSGRIALNPLNDGHAAATLAACQHPRTSLNQRLITPNRARLASKQCSSPLASTRSAKPTGRRLLYLCGAGIAEPDVNRDIALAAKVRLSLYPQ
jgi:hypothetical protein